MSSSGPGSGSSHSPNSSPNSSSSSQTRTRSISNVSIAALELDVEFLSELGFDLVRDETNQFVRVSTKGLDGLTFMGECNANANILLAPDHPNSGLIRKLQGKQFHFKEKCVIKILKQKAEQTVMEWPIKEAHIQIDLKHPNIAKLYAMIRSGKEGVVNRYVITEYIYGRTLEYLWKRVGEISTLTPNKSKYLIVGILEGIKYLHSRHISHRDLHSGNVMVQYIVENNNPLASVVTFDAGRPIVKIIDFGESMIEDINATEQQAKDGYASDQKALGRLLDRIILHSELSLTVQNAGAVANNDDELDVYVPNGKGSENVFTPIINAMKNNEYPNISAVIEALRPLLDHIECDIEFSNTVVGQGCTHTLKPMDMERRERNGKGW